MAGARAVASPTITFGLVSIPTKAYVAASSESFSFNLITKNGNRVKQLLVDSITGEKVERGECSKGYEYEKDKYIILNDDELKALEGEKNNYIEICEVVSDMNLSPACVEKAYYLSPDKSDRSYKLLAKCLKSAKKIAVGKWQTRGKDNLVALVPSGDLLMMFQLYYAPELRDMSQTFAKNSEPSDKEVQLAGALLEQLYSKDFDLNKYKDEYCERVAVAIAKKQNGEEVSVVKQGAEAVAFDLAALLERSLKETG